MSNGGGEGAAILVLPIAAVAAVGYAAFVVVQACGELTAAGARRVVRLADEMERESQERHDAERAAFLWGLAASEVMELNATLRLLRQQAPASVTLPDPVAIQGHTVAQIDELLRVARPMVARARLEVERATLAASRAKLLEEARRLPAPPVGPSMAEIIAEHEAALLHRHHTDTERHPDREAARSHDDARVAHLHARVDALVSDVDPDVTLDEREHVLFEATRAKATTSLEYLPDYVEHLETYIPAANARAARRRLAAQLLEVIEHEVVADADPVPPRIAEAAKELACVVRGEDDLTAGMEARARRAVEDVDELARARHLRDVLEQCLVQQGHTILERFDRGLKAGLRTTKPQWNGEHSVDFVIDARSYEAVLTQDSADVREVDERERCADLVDDIVDLPTLLRQRGIDAPPAHTNKNYRPQARHDGRRAPKHTTPPPRQLKHREHKP